jgi:hypothetical protein
MNWLEPMRARLEHEDSIRAEEIPWYVDNKDSNIYVLWIVLGNDALLGITPGDGERPDGTETWLVNWYRDEDEYRSEDDRELLSFGADLSADRVVAIIDAHLYPEQTRERITSVSEATLNQGHAKHTSFATDDQIAAWHGLQDTRDLPSWMRQVQTFRYLSEEVDDLILLACTYPTR